MRQLALTRSLLSWSMIVRVPCARNCRLVVSPLLSISDLWLMGRWAPLPSCLWSLLIRIFPSLPGSRLTIFYRNASSALLQLVNQWLNFTYSRPNGFRYGRQNKNPDKNRIHDFHSSRCAGHLLDHSGDEGVLVQDLWYYTYSIL